MKHIWYVLDFFFKYFFRISKVTFDNKDRETWAPYCLYKGIQCNHVIFLLFK